MFKVIMVKGRKLKKVGGDLEVYKQNDISSKPIIREQNVTPSKPEVDESNNPCGLKLAMVVICNSNDEPFQDILGIWIEKWWVRLF
jgi:hypothetical protein